jgi:hypothetical protein
VCRSDFYKRFSPEQAGKAAGLLAKADTPSKFAALLTKLIAKYPQVKNMEHQTLT